MASRLGLFYAAFFLISGIQLPFWPVWLKAQGLSPNDISILLAVAVWARIPANPLFAHIADRQGRRRGPIMVLAWLSPVVFALYIMAGSFPALFAISLILGLLWSPILPLGDNLTLLVAYRDNLDYGRIRVWGSISFMLATIAGGRLLADSGASIILGLILAGMLLHAAVCSLLPEVEVKTANRAEKAPVLQLLRQPLFVLFLFGGSVAQASHGVYYAFSAVYWRSEGLSGTTIGLLWAEGVIAEILLFIVSGGLLARVGPIRLLLIGAVAGILRWTGTATSTDLIYLIPLQALHGLTFGAAHLGAMHFIGRAIPPDRSASAQSLYSATSGGVGMGLALLAAGPLYAAFGPGAFLAMTALSALGGLALAMVGRRWRGATLSF